SHYIAGGALMKGLAAKGHDVTVISPFPQDKPMKNYRDVTILGVDKLIGETFPHLIHMDGMNFVDKLNLIFNIGVAMTNYTLTHDVMRTFLHTNVKFDVIVMEIFMNEAFLGLSHHFQAPVVGFATFGASKWTNDMVGNPNPMSHVPHFQAKFSERMTFFQRVINVVMFLSESVYMKWFYMGRQEKLYNEIFPDPKPTLDVLHKNVSLILLNNHFSLHYPRPYVTNMIEVGGLQINRTPRKLPSDLQEILDKAKHGAIYFSLGTNVRSQNIPVEKQREILNVFRKLNQTVLWKWDDQLPEKLDNVFVNHWYPQDDILAHPNVKLFITHGGLLSITETIYHAVPVIGIPLFGDQFLNMAKAQRSGYALTVLLNELNESTLSAAIREILTNDKYSKQVKLLSDRYRDQPLTPLETAIYWTEYVAQIMDVWKMFSVLFYLLFLAGSADSYKILGIFHTFSKSHYIAGGALMKGLAAKGHNVTVISPFPQDKPMKNFRDVTILGVDELIEEMFPNLTKMGDMSFLVKLNQLLDIGVALTNYTLTHDVMQEFLRINTTFDVIIIEIFMSEAFLGLGHHFQAPVVGFSSFGTNKWTNDMVGNPNPISYIPHFQGRFSNGMTFFERVGNLLMHLGESALISWFYMGRQEKLYNDIFPDPKPTLDVLHKNVSLILVNNHFTLNYPRPYVPNMIEVGGLHINRTPRKLPLDLQEILDKAEHGAIYFSLGSNVKSQNIPVEKQREILNVFRKLNQTVLWKWDDELPEKLDNVFVNHWYPQDDILAHPNVKLFITHGGFLSITETIYHAVPIIGIPLFADQFMNIAKAQSCGYALKVLLKELNEATLSTAIREILTNDTYSKQVKLMSDRYRDQPLTPLETAIYWTEYVARHKGAPHMRSAGLDLSFFAYYSIDVCAFLFTLIYLAWRFVKLAFDALFMRNYRQNTRKARNAKED
ncbi:UDP-glucosyltransferase 2, partial [Pseudolycoriella hygida]